MGTIELRKNEKLLFEGKASWWNFWLLILTGIITTIVLFGFVILAFAYLARLSTEYTVTNQRVFSKYGLISRHINDTSLDKVQDTRVIQGVMGRFLNFGDLSFNTAGGHGYEIVFKGVPNPISVREIANDATEIYKKSG